MKLVNKNLRTTVSLPKNLVLNLQALVGKGNVGQEISLLVKKHLRTEKRKKILLENKKNTGKNPAFSTQQVLQAYKNERK